MSGHLLVLAGAAAQPEASAGARWANVAILVVVAIAAYLLLTRVRKAASRARLRRWERDGLVQPPTDPPEPTDPTVLPDRPTKATGLHDKTD